MTLLLAYSPLRESHHHMGTPMRIMMRYADIHLAIDETPDIMITSTGLVSHPFLKRQVRAKLN